MTFDCHLDSINHEYSSSQLLKHSKFFSTVRLHHIHKYSDPFTGQLSTALIWKNCKAS